MGARGPRSLRRPSAPEHGTIVTASLTCVRSSGVSSSISFMTFFSISCVSSAPPFSPARLMEAKSSGRLAVALPAPPRPCEEDAWVPMKSKSAMPENGHPTCAHRADNGTRAGEQACGYPAPPPRASRGGRGDESDSRRVVTCDAAGPARPALLEAVRWLAARWRSADTDVVMDAKGGCSGAFVFSLLMNSLAFSELVRTISPARETLDMSCSPTDSAFSRLTGGST